MREGVCLYWLFCGQAEATGWAPGLDRRALFAYEPRSFRPKGAETFDESSE